MNRMFPGYMQGETTQRIAGALFDAVKGYRYGIHFASFYLPGDFVPHVRIMDTGYQTSSLGNLFGLPYARPAGDFAAAAFRGNAPQSACPVRRDCCCGR